VAFEGTLPRSRKLKNEYLTVSLIKYLASIGEGNSNSKEQRKAML
jgi:hypothetical protein